MVFKCSDTNESRVISNRSMGESLPPPSPRAYKNINTDDYLYAVNTGIILGTDDRLAVLIKCCIRLHSSFATMERPSPGIIHISIIGLHRSWPKALLQERIFPMNLISILHRSAVSRYNFCFVNSLPIKRTPPTIKLNCAPTLKLRYHSKWRRRGANNESSEVCVHLLPVTYLV